MTAARTNPRKIARRERENCRLKRYAINAPVHAPVNGTGSATKAKRPRYSYFLIRSSAFFRVRANSQSMIFTQKGYRLRNCSTCLKMRRINGIGNIFPAIARGNACHHSHPYCIMEKGMTYRASSQGTIEKKNIWNHCGKNSSTSYPPTDVPNPFLIRI